MYPVLCLGENCPEYLRSAHVWKKEFRISFQHKNIENWTTSMVTNSCSSGRFSRKTTAQLLQAVQKLMADELKIQPQNVEDCIIFMSMCNDIDWSMKDNRNHCAENSSRVSEYARKFPLGAPQCAISSRIFKKSCLVYRISWIGPKVYGSRVLCLIKECTCNCCQTCMSSR